MKTKTQTLNNIRRLYTEVVKIGDAWNTYLKIDHQSFCVVEQTSNHRAKWFSRMLAIALMRLLKDKQT